MSLNWSMAPDSPIMEQSSPSNTNQPSRFAIDVKGLAALRAKANVNMDMFLDIDPTKAQSTVMAAYEMMVWIGMIGGAQPFNSRKTPNPPTYTLGNTTFSLFTGSNQAKQTVYTWLADRNLTTVPAGTDFYPLLQYLYQNNLIPASTYLGVLQVGTETYHAHDKVLFEIEGLNMTVSGENQPAGAATPTGTEGHKGNQSGAGARIGLESLGSTALTVVVGVCALALSYYRFGG
ncbi:MAG: hypothetical protein Q9217_000959 [Psora testacea]